MSTTTNNNKATTQGGGKGWRPSIPTEIRHTICARPQCHNGGVLEMDSIQIRGGGSRKITITNVYCPPIRTVANEDRTGGFELEDLTQSNPTIIGGDLNAHSILWDEHQPTDDMGERLENCMMEKNLVCANTGCATRINKGTGGLSTPDITILPAHWANKVTWSTRPCMGSDHLPILIELDIDVETKALKPTFVEGWRWAKADWNMYT